MRSKRIDEVIKDSLPAESASRVFWCLPTVKGGLSNGYPARRRDWVTTAEKYPRGEGPLRRTTTGARRTRGRWLLGQLLEWNKKSEGDPVLALRALCANRRIATRLLII